MWNKDGFLDNQGKDAGSPMLKGVDSIEYYSAAQSNESMFTCKIICGYLEGYRNKRTPPSASAVRARGK